jgi:hypothetical protein
MTTVDLGDRQSGKTTRAVLWALGDPKKRTVVVHNYFMKKFVQDIAYRCGYDSDVVDVTTFQEFLQSKGRPDREYWIDELLLCLPGNVAGVSGVR